MGLYPHNRSEVSCFGLAVAQVLERRHPVHTAKMVARTLSASGTECTVRTAENILQGHLSARTITRLVEGYGLGLLLEAWSAMTGQSLEDFIEESAEAARREQAAWGQKIVGYNSLLGRLRENTPRAPSAGREMAGTHG